jgi:hypothetical protein
MVDETGILSQEEKERAEKWIKDHTKSDKRGPAGVVLGGTGYPQLMLISEPCGYTRFMNAVVMGLHLHRGEGKQAASRLRRQAKKRLAR